MKKTLLTLLALGTLATAPLLAQGAATPETVQAGAYRIDSNHTLALFSLNHLGFNDYYGTIPGATGTLTLDPKAVAKTILDVTLPAARISTTNATLDGELTGAEWFDAANYPDIHFVSRKVTKTGARTADIAGDLTLHGVTKPVVLAATFQGAGTNPMTKAYTLGFKATGRIKRTDFGISKYAPLLGDTVTLTLTAAFEKAG